MKESGSILSVTLKNLLGKWSTIASCINQAECKWHWKLRGYYTEFTFFCGLNDLNNKL